MTGDYTPSDLSWSEPGCFAVAEGVHRVPLSMPNDGLRAVNVYVLETPDGLALIDGGWRVDSALGELERGLMEIGRHPDEIQDIYVTHIHRDHYTFAVELRRKFGSRIHLGRPEGPGLDGIIEIQNNVPVSSLRELLRSGAPELAMRIQTQTLDESFDAQGWEQPDGWLDPGTITIGSRELEVVPTPGHTKGHVVFHDHENALLFSGDHVLPTITPSIGFELGEWDLPLSHYLESLHLLLDRPDARLVPAHGYPTGSVHDRVRELLAHHDSRFDEMRYALADAGEPVTALTMAGRLKWTRRKRPLADLDDFNQMIATCETIAHLDVLVDTGAAAVTLDRGVERFSLTR